MTKVFRFFLAVLLLPLQSFAAPKAYFDAEEGYWLSSPNLVIDGKTYERNFWGDFEVEDAFRSHQKAQEIAKNAAFNRALGNGFAIAGLVGAIGYSSSTTSENYSSSTYWSIFLLGFIPGMIMIAGSEKQLVRAINHYNGVYDTPKTTTFLLTPAGLLVTF